MQALLVSRDLVSLWCVLDRRGGLQATWVFEWRLRNISEDQSRPGKIGAKSTLLWTFKNVLWLVGLLVCTRPNIGVACGAFETWNH